MAAKKSNIRSIRFSDEIAEMINAQVGDTFTDKFTNLVTKCCWELPGKEEELKRLESLITRKQQEFTELLHKTQKLSRTLDTLSMELRNLEGIIKRETAKWEDVTQD